MIRVVGYGLAVAMQAVMYLSFLIAYFVGDGFVLISIDSFGEADFELVACSVAMVLSWLGFYVLCKRCLVGNRKDD